MSSLSSSASSSTPSTTCLICNGNCASPRNSIPISKERSFSGTTLVQTISKVLNKELSPQIIATGVICKKCYGLFEETDELQQRMKQISSVVLSNYNNSIKRNESEYGDDAVEVEMEAAVEEGESVRIEGDRFLVVEDSKNEIESKKKILDIPSTDEDESSPQVLLNGDLDTMESIELELVKIHSDQNNSEIVEGIVAEEEDDVSQNQSFAGNNHQILGTLEYSDSEYETVTSSNRRKTKIQRKKQTQDIKIKLEPFESVTKEKPNILRRYNSTNSQENLYRIKEEPENVDIAPLQPPLENSVKPTNSTTTSTTSILNPTLTEDKIPSLILLQDSLFTCLLCYPNSDNPSDTITTDEEDGIRTASQCDVREITLHMRVAHDIRVYICDVCGQDFRKRNELSVHLDEHVAAEEGDFQCEVCNRIFCNLRLFRIHRRMHYPQNKTWKCETCGKKYNSRNLLDEHMNTHTGLRPYVCGQCGKDFASKYTFKAHERTHEIRARPHGCAHCPKRFLSQQNLVQHERTHSGVKEFSCHLCGKQFGSAHNLEVHSIVHSGFKQYRCSMCNKAFARKAEVKDHERTHTGEKPYQCETCGATFAQRSNLQSHKRATHLDDKRHVCMDCGKGFKRRRLLDYHMKAVHTGERPFKCDICDASFVYPEHFKKHRRIHTGEKPFLCEVCGRAFNSRDNRNAHRFIHSDKKPYECLVCGAGFMRKPLLYQHMQTQDHLNDTIVVNQPRLTTDDDQLVTMNSRGEMEIVDSTAAAATFTVTEEAAGEDSKLYISEHILQTTEMSSSSSSSSSNNANQIININPKKCLSGDKKKILDAIEHIVIDGEQLRFESLENDDEEEIEEITAAADLVDGDEIDENVLCDEEMEEKVIEHRIIEEKLLVNELDEHQIETITGDTLSGSETQIIETPDGPIQLVRVRISNEQGEDEEAWIKILSE